MTCHTATSSRHSRRPVSKTTASRHSRQCTQRDRTLPGSTPPWPMHTPPRGKRTKPSISTRRCWPKMPATLPQTRISETCMRQWARIRTHTPATPPRPNSMPSIRTLSPAQARCTRSSERSKAIKLYNDCLKYNHSSQTVKNRLNALQPPKEAGKPAPAPAGPAAKPVSKAENVPAAAQPQVPAVKQ